MITKLKAECGYQFTSKLEGMFTDMKVSADTMESFRAAREDESSSVDGVELSVHVLTTGFWPTQSTHACSLPPQLQKCTEVFREVYMKLHSGRRLSWQANMGNVDLRARFVPRKHEINTSTYQACILMLFNAVDTMSYSDIAETTGIPAADLKRALQSLACAKFKILLKEPRGRDVDEKDTFRCADTHFSHMSQTPFPHISRFYSFCSYNAHFATKQLRFKVGTVSAQKETDVEKCFTRQKVEEDRKPQIEAAIVRTMKSRKAMEHNALIAEVRSKPTYVP